MSFPEQGAPPASGGEQERTLVVCPGPQELLQLLHADHVDHEPSTEIQVGLCYSIARGSKPGHFLVPHSLLSRPSPSQGLPPANGGEHERTLVAEPPPQELLQLLQADHGDHEPSTERSMNDLLLEPTIDQQVDPTWAFLCLTVLTFYALSRARLAPKLRRGTGARSCGDSSSTTATATAPRRPIRP